MRIRSYKKFAPLTVTWVDIVDDPSWRTVEDMFNKSVILVKQPGYFITNKHCEERGNMLILATSLSEDGAGGYVVIPWGCVRRIDYNG